MTSIHVVLSEDKKTVTGIFASPQHNSVAVELADPRYYQFYNSLHENARQLLPQPVNQA